ncbi:hypothetical protein PLESTB_000084500 [Pleodorina starrii]|uniref:Uncharacterized protein n=1 Tax=Pleodorina starrii TaxID=330485 RepID=A0A9W6BA30_9CHLO|nr:hypothetical protein PLESTB_000084500 [Pleodorina starrii]
MQHTTRGRVAARRVRLRCGYDLSTAARTRVPSRLPTALPNSTPSFQTPCPPLASTTFFLLDTRKTTLGEMLGADPSIVKQASVRGSPQRDPPPQSHAPPGPPHQTSPSNNTHCPARATRNPQRRVGHRAAWRLPCRRTPRRWLPRCQPAPKPHQQHGPASFLSPSFLPSQGHACCTSHPSRRQHLLHAEPQRHRPPVRLQPLHLRHLGHGGTQVLEPLVRQVLEDRG